MALDSGGGTCDNLGGEIYIIIHLIVEIALLKDLRDPFTAFLCYFCGKKSAKRPDIMCCCHGGEESSRCACGLLSVLNAALLKRNTSDSATSQSSAGGEEALLGWGVEN